ncbi:MAG: PhoPQ-activated protein PqaA family protein [Gammaproteobacteria bacterium]|nr:PhoPQ-activated protein PqaA family protein [Gammaproteobacteria bacterium]
MWKRWVNGLAVAVLTTAAAGANQTVIDEYVNAPDDSYSWQVAATHPGEHVDTVVIDLVSQHWLTQEQVDRTEWRHWLVVAIPKETSFDAALLFIGGGSNAAPGEAEPPGPNERMMQIAAATGTVAAELRMVPNQPLTFHGDGQPRWEDDLIGYAWAHYLETGDSAWLPRGPMVKSAVRAMDALEEFSAGREDIANVSRFVVAGGSKRGWTTWLTGAMDSRVIAIAPIVIDVLSVDASMRHHFAVYGFWAPAIGNYVAHGIMQRMDHPRLAEIYRLVDPHAYLHRLTIPKLVLNAAGDQFFLPDSSQFYWNDLRGESYLRYVANADHSMDDGSALATLTAFHWMMVRGKRPPQLAWTRTDHGLATLTNPRPQAARVWHATNPRARDFRVETLGRKYVASPVAESRMNVYRAPTRAPEKGWSATFMEFEWNVGAPTPFKLTTEVVVVPDQLPFADKPPSLPPSATVTCNADSPEAAKQLAEDLPDALAKAGFTPLRLDTKLDGRDLYLNWPVTARVGEELQAVRAHLTHQQCDAPALQLESGPAITLPPVPR